MKQLLQSAADGTAAVLDVPAPGVQPGCVLVRNAASLVSAGTERTAVEFAKKSLLAKARSRPDLVRKVLDKARTDGPVSAVQAAFSRLDQPMALGYSSAGVVLEVGEGVEGVRAGDRVACAGAGYASHADVVCVPRNLVAPVPDGVALEHAAFATVGAIGLHGFRLAEVQLGERVAVIGLGLIGLLTVQMARAAGARVLGVDLDPNRVAKALELGADAAVAPDGAEEAALALSGGEGVDAVLVTAGTSSNQPIELAGRIARDRGRVVVVGAVGMDLPRPPFFEKELAFRVSRSYGPGRYDPVYEEGGVDYPIGYVRWTENRNLCSFLEMVATGAVRVEPLVTHRIPIEEGARAYALLTTPGEALLGVVLTYGDAQPRGDSGAPAAGVAAAPARRVDITPATAAGSASGPGVGFLGAGAFATAVLLPALKKAGGFRLTGIASARGPSARHAAGKFGFRFAASAEEEILSDPSTDLVAVLTRHDLHARQIVAALRAGKHVFCEKPPCLGEDQLAYIVRALRAAGPGRILAVGYNRRFAPMMLQVREHMAAAGEPLAVQMRVNAGVVPLDHWIHDPAVGGGRIVGEVCHFVDLAGFVTGAVPVSVHARGLPDRGRYREDNVVISLGMSDGSVATITYVAAGDRALGKERFEVFGGGRSAVVDDFREVRLFGGGRARSRKDRLAQDKGHRGEWEALGRVLRQGGEPPISLESLVATSLATFAAVRSLRSGVEEKVDAAGFIAGVTVPEGA
jgi:predicted dehydrogenase/threonine dehydrogenase-like Zn-dependent dehydrogenase